MSQAHYAECHYTECRNGECLGAIRAGFRVFGLTGSITPKKSFITLRLGRPDIFQRHQDPLLRPVHVQGLRREDMGPMS